jgi:hypothetical protein
VKQIKMYESKLGETDFDMGECEINPMKNGERLVNPILIWIGVLVQS